MVLGLLIFLVTVALVALGGGGWYFASQIHADGLSVNPFVPKYTLEVVAADDGTITISDPDEEYPVLRTDSVYGAHYRAAESVDDAAADGFAQLVGASAGGEQVTRDIVVLTGRPPATGDMVGVDRSAFPGAPEVLGTPVEDVMVGEFPAWFAPGGSDTWAILVHGKGGNRAEMLRMMRTTVEAGLPSLAITYRNDVGVSQDEEAMYRFGTTEWEDLAAAVAYAEDNGAQEVVVVAVSLGAAITASYLERVPDAPVSALVLDAPMLDFGATVSHGASQRTLPVVGTVPEAITWTAKRIASLRYGVDWGEIDYLDDTTWVTVPTLVFHGTADKTVPVSVSRRLAEGHADLVEYVEVNGAGHVESWNADPDAYDATLQAFLAER